MIRFGLAMLMATPVATMVLAGLLADGLGCHIASTPQPCYLWSMDVGSILHELLVLDGLSFVIIPAGAIALVAYEIVHFVQSGRQW